MSRDIEVKVKERKVVKLFKDLIYDLDRATPNGLLIMTEQGIEET